MATEKRRHSRVRTKEMAAHLSRDNSLTFCAVENLSSGGAFVRTDQTIPVGTPVSLRVARPGMKRGLELTGRVVTAISAASAGPGGCPGMGVRFEDLDADTTSRLAVVLRDLSLRGGSIANAELTSVEAPTPIQPATSVSSIQKVLDQKDAEIAWLKQRLENSERSYEQCRQTIEIERVLHETELEKNDARHTRVHAELQRQLEKTAVQLGELRRKRS
jgi:uncharacterized protein (TIGR02266 family)